MLTIDEAESNFYERKLVFHNSFFLVCEVPSVFEFSLNVSLLKGERNCGWYANTMELRSLFAIEMLLGRDEEEFTERTDQI